MRKELLHIGGPFAIQNYGLAIAIGILLFSWFFLRHPKRSSIVSTEHFMNILSYGIIAGLVGGRLLALLSDLNEVSIVNFFSIDGGFSVLGTIITILLFCCVYLRYLQVPILPFLDLLALYAPLLQSISRIGCFAAGCCFGKPTSALWGICYTDSHSYAPLFISIHPTQLYSSLLLFVLFILLYCFLQYRTKASGQLLMLYLMGMSIERFAVDFFRADQEWLSAISFVSLHQLLALIIFAIGCGGYIVLMNNNDTKSIKA